MANTAKKSQAAQDFVPIKEVRDGVVVLKDGSIRGVLMASSLNFALKSEDEQQAIIMSFQSFLNSLDFSVQFTTQSRELDIRPYLALLEERYKEQTNELLKIQTAEYIEFIKTFTDETDIMEKTFLIVVPWNRSVASSSGGISGLLSFGDNKGKKSDEKKEAEIASFEEARVQLEQRIGVVEQGLVRCGVRVAQLGSEELIELYYQIFNPGDLEKPVQAQS